MRASNIGPIPRQANRQAFFQRRFIDKRRVANNPPWTAVSQCLIIILTNGHFCMRQILPVLKILAGETFGAFARFIWNRAFWPQAG
jgi:hypothetical protein